MGVSELQALIARARPILPPDLHTAVCDPTQEAEDLFPVEAAAITRAITRRRREFAAGRMAARAALAEYGLPGLPIPMAEDRAPVWPKGITGSISHANDACLAVVAPRATAQAVGVDIEPLVPLSASVLAEVSTRSERAHFDEVEALAATRIFSAKEAAYKAQYQLSRTLIGFEALRVQQVLGAAVTLTFTQPVPPFQKGHMIAVHQWLGEGYVLSLTIMPRRAAT